MVTVLGQDSFAQSVRENAADIGLDLTHSAVIPGGRTGTYLFIDGCDGDMALAVNDMGIYEHITPEFLRQRLDFINHAGLVVVETNLPEASLQWLCQHCTAPILADPVSTIKAPQLHRPHKGLILSNIHAASLPYLRFICMKVSHEACLTPDVF